SSSGVTTAAIMPPRGGSGGGSDAETGVGAAPPPLFPYACSARIGSFCGRDQPWAGVVLPYQRRFSCADQDRAGSGDPRGRLGACPCRAAGRAVALGKRASSKPESAAAWLKRGSRGRRNCEQ